MFVDWDSSTVLMLFVVILLQFLMNIAVVTSAYVYGSLIVEQCESMRPSCWLV